MRACGRKPCSAKPSGKLKSKHIKAPPQGGFLIGQSQSTSRFSGANRCRPSGKIFEPRITLQKAMFPFPIRRRMTRIFCRALAAAFRPPRSPPAPACPDTRAQQYEEEVTKKVGPPKRPQVGEMITCWITCWVTAGCSSAHPSDRRS